MNAVRDPSRFLAAGVKGGSLKCRRLFTYGKPLSWKCLLRVSLEVSGEVAEWPKAAVC
jgi:hypothetical protein